MTKAAVLLKTFLLSILPISELRGGMPFAFFNDVPLWLSFLAAVASNMLVTPIAWFFLATFHKLLCRLGWYRRFFERFIQKARAKISEKVQRHGYWGLMVFVGVPLPVTGAWTGALGAWVLGLDKRKTLLFICLGVLMSGIIVATLLRFGVGLNSILIKHISI